MTAYAALPAIFDLGVLDGLPLHVADCIRPTITQRVDVIFHKSGTRAVRLAGGGAGVEILEFARHVAGAVFGGVSSHRKAEREKENVKSRVRPENTEKIDDRIGEKCAQHKNGRDDGCSSPSHHAPHIRAFCRRAKGAV